MKEPASSFSEAELAGLIAESSGTIRIATTPTREVFDRILQFNRLLGAVAEKPTGNALLYRLPGSGKVRFEPLGERIVVGRLRKSPRNPDACDLAFPELSEMSRKHFEIVLTDGFFVLRDLGSQNGTYINNQPSPTRAEVLKAGDIIVAGGVSFAYTGGEEI
jgi:hypothetical protein